MLKISSRSNPRLKELRSLLSKKGRSASGMFQLEGPDLVDEALRQSVLNTLVVSEDRLERFASQLALAENSGISIVSVPDSFFPYITDTVNPSGIAGAALYCHQEFSKVIKNDHVLLLCGISDPGNLGAVMRTATAAGVGLLISKGSVDPYNPKVVRSAMGAHFAASWGWEANVGEVLIESSASGHRIIATHPNKGKAIYETDLREKSVVVLGGERSGLSEEILSRADLVSYIPLKGMESLNLSVAAGIYVYEILRQLKLG